MIPCVKLRVNNHIVGLVHKNHIIRTCLRYHAACKVDFQPFKQVVLIADDFQISSFSTYFFIKYVSCEYNRLNGWNSNLQATWYIRRVRIIWFSWTKPTIWLLILSFTQNIVRAYSMFYPYGYRSVTPLDAARVNMTIFHNHSVHWYYITLIKGRDYVKHDLNIRHGKQNPRRGRWL